MHRSIPWRAAAAHLALCLWAGVAVAQAQPTLPTAGSEVLDVSLFTVPFYATDGDGRPVYDLEADEIALRIDGVLHAVDTLDRSRVGSQVAPAQALDVAPADGRFVFLLFDQAFTTARGLRQSQHIADAMIDGLQPTDRIFGFTNHARLGFRQEVGPIVASDQGRSRARTWVAGLRPNVGMLNPNADEALYADLIATPQLHNALIALGANARSEYREMAELFAESLASFADSLLSVREPKLLYVFSSGIHDELYFDGENGLKNGSEDDSGAYQGQTRRAGPLRYRFEAALDKLASSGTVAAFVNGAGIRTRGRSMLFHMADASGGRLFEHGSARVMERTIRNATSAYYVAGFYPTDAIARAERVEIVVSRPGVETLGPNRVLRRQRYGDLDALGRRNVIVDLVYRGAIGALEVAETMAGKVRSRQADDGVELLFRPELPATAHGKAIDLYEVALAVDGASDEGPNVLRYGRTSWRASPEPLELVAEVPENSTVLWGVVAVEAETGRAYVRRLELSNGWQGGRR